MLIMTSLFRNCTLFSNVVQASQKLIRKNRECANMCKSVQKNIGINFDNFGCMRK